MLNLDNGNKKGHTYRQWLFSLLANCTLFGFGMECGWISQTIKILLSENSPTGEPVTYYTISWIASSITIATIFSVSLHTFISDNYGRRIGIIIIAVLQALSWLIRLSYPSTTGLIMGRVLAGLSAGGCFTVIPMYVKEISQDDTRGVLGTLIILLQSMGLLVMYTMGLYLGYNTVMFVALAFPIVVSVLFFKAPESPSFLIKQEKYDVAAETVAYLRSLDKNDETVRKYIEYMKNEDAYFKTLPSITYLSLLKEKSWRRGLLLITMTFLFHACNGAYAIIAFSWTILMSTGVKFEISPEILTFSFPILMMVGTLLLAAFIEKCGRKPLLIAAFLISGSSMAVIAILMVLQHHSWTTPQWLPVLAITLVVIMYGGGVCPLPYIIMTEMLNFQIRGKVAAIVITLTWTLSAILVNIYLPLSEYIGPYAPFILYAIINFLGSVFTLLYIPETRANTEKEISLFLEKGRSVQNNSI